MRYITILLAFLLTTAQAHARQLTPSEYASLNAVVVKFITDMEQKNMDGITDAIPARIINHYSGIVEMNPEQLRLMMAEQMKGMMTDVTSISIDVDLSGLDVTDAQNTDGTTAVYAVLPYAMSLTVKDKPVNATSVLIAMHEAGKWWLARVAPNETEQLIELYPFLKDVDF